VAALVFRVAALVDVVGVFFGAVLAAAGFAGVACAVVVLAVVVLAVVVLAVVVFAVVVRFGAAFVADTLDAAFFAVAP